MSTSSTHYLVCYDVGGPLPRMRRRLSRVRRCLIGVATPIQYSVFCGAFTPAGRKALLGELARRIDPRHDDLRLYPLPLQSPLLCLGRPVLPAGLFTPMPHRPLVAGDEKKGS